MKRKDFTLAEREYWLNFLLQRDGYCCVQCKKDVTTLLRESKPDRKMPVLVIDHIDGDTRFTDSRDNVHGGNLRLLCYSCNRKNTKQARPAMPDREKPPELAKADRFKPVFYKWLDSILESEGHVCYKKMLNRGSKVAGSSSQVTVKRWYDQYFEAVDGYEEFEVLDVDMSCDYGKCDGTHVCFFGHAPRKQDATAEFNEDIKSKLEN